MGCRVGDLAVVVDAYYRSNLGRIVRVVAPHDGVGDIVFPAWIGQVWLVGCAQPMTWSAKGKRYRRKTGPVPDSRLKPIRGLSPGDDVSAAAEKLLGEVRQSSEEVEA